LFSLRTEQQTTKQKGHTMKDTKKLEVITDIVRVKDFSDYIELKKYETLLGEKLTVLKNREEETLRLLKEINDVAVVVRKYQTKIPEHANIELKKLAMKKAGF